MSNENRSELIHDALNLLDEDMIEDADRLRGGVTESVSKFEEAKERRFNWRRFTAIAASLCVLVIGGWAWQNFHEPNSGAEQEKGEDKDAMVEYEESSEENVEDVIVGNHPTDSFVDSEESMKGEENEPGDSIDQEVEKELLVSYGSLKDNCVQVSMIPHKVWTSAASEEAAMQQAVVIDAKYKKDMDKLIEAMTVGKGRLTEELPESNPDMIYHLFFEKVDGEIIHCWLLEDGYIYNPEKSDWCVALDREVYANTFKILALHW